MGSSVLVFYGSICVYPARENTLIELTSEDLKMESRPVKKKYEKVIGDQDSKIYEVLQMRQRFWS